MKSQKIEQENKFDIIKKKEKRKLNVTCHFCDSKCKLSHKFIQQNIKNKCTIYSLSFALLLMISECNRRCVSFLSELISIKFNKTFCWNLCWCVSVLSCIVLWAQNCILLLMKLFQRASLLSWVIECVCYRAAI